MSDSHLSLTISDRGIALITIDVPNARVNVLSRTLMTQLNAILDQLASDKNVRAVIFQSGKEDNFIAGADVAAIKELERQSPINAYEASQLGKMIFAKIAKLPVRTIAAIKGTCLGGGTELTLHCRYRIAADLPATNIGLPEVKLGIVPGWGGTIMMPRVIALQAALNLIMSGQTVNAKLAWRMGLVDEYVAPDKLLARAEEIALGALPQRYQKPFKQSVQEFLLEKNPVGRSIVQNVAFKHMMRETKGKYPAPREALKLIMRNLNESYAVAAETESQVFAKLAVSEISRNLVGIFFAQTESKKMPAKTESNHQIKTVGVLGAGIMGAGIAQAAAYSGYKVVLKDVEPQFIDKGMSNITKLFDNLVAKKKLTEADRNRMLTSIKPTLDYADLSDCDLVVEAVLEVLNVKQDALLQLEKVIDKPFIFATNTSSLSVDEIGKAAKEPQNTVGVHFFNPVHKMPLVEIVKGAATSEATLSKAKEFALKLGKTAVTTSNAPGFVVNRILTPYLREAVILLEQGVSPESIDKAMTSWGMPMGPFTLMDEIGLDIGAKVMHVLYQAFGERMAPPAVFDKLEKLKLLGKKGGKGFYLYNEMGKKTEFNPDVLAAIDAEPCAKQPGEIQDRLTLIMVNEAARCLEEDVIADPAQLDLALVFGIGFPPFRGGILRYADHLSLKIVHQKLAFLATVAGENYAPCYLILEKVATGSRFYVS